MGKIRMKNGSNIPPQKKLRCGECGATAARNGNPFTAFTLRVHQGRMHPVKAVADEALRLGLSCRQQEIMELIVAGKTKNDAAAELGLSIHTVHQHVRTIYAKLGLKNRVEAVKKWLEEKRPARQSAAIRYCPGCGCHLASLVSRPSPLAANAMAASLINPAASWSPLANRNRPNAIQ